MIHLSQMPWVNLMVTLGHAGDLIDSVEIGIRADSCSAFAAIVPLLASHLGWRSRVACREMAPRTARHNLAKPIDRSLA
jgi:hypothetical protein